MPSLLEYNNANAAPLRRSIQRRAMAGRDPTAEEQAYLDAEMPRLEQNSQDVRDELLKQGLLMAMPVGRIAQAARAMPRTLGGLLGGFAATAPAAVATGDDDGLTEAQRKRLSELNGKRSLTRAEREEKIGIDKQLSEYQGLKNRARTDSEARDIQNAQGELRERLDKAEKPFAQKFPVWNEVQPFMPGLIGMATMAPIAGRAAAGFNRTARAWDEAAAAGLKATNPVELAAANNAAQSFAKEMPKATVSSTMKGYAVPAAIGAAEGAAVANLPEAYNSFLPGVHPERAAYEDYIKRLPPGSREAIQAKEILATLPQTQPEKAAALNHFTSMALPARMATGAFEGAGGAAFSTTLGKGLQRSEKGLPRAQTEALAARVEGKGLDEATRAIEAESKAIGTVLPMPPERVQLPPPRPPQPDMLGPPQQMPAQPPQIAAQPSGGLLDLPLTPKQQPRLESVPATTTPPLPSKKRFDPSLYGIGAAGAGVGAGGMPGGGMPGDSSELARLRLMVQAGLLPPSVLEGM